MFDQIGRARCLLFSFSYELWLLERSCGSGFEAALHVGGGGCVDQGILVFFLHGTGQYSSPLPRVANNIVVGSSSPSRVIVILAKV